MNLFKFYRLDFCLRNLGLGIIAIFSLDFIPPMGKTALAILQILLIQMNSFSMNNYYDALGWKEKNYIYYLLKKRRLKQVYIKTLTLLPLFLLLLTIPFANKFILILVTYFLLFLLYHLPKTRKIFKEHYLPSIIINSLCLGTFLFLYPYLYLAGNISFIAVVFSLIFFFYLGFHEIVHQIAHQGEDKIYSLPQAVGIKKAVFIGNLFLFLAILISAYAVFINPVKYFFFTGTVIFSLFRVYKLSKMPSKQEHYKKLRDRKDKFYSFQEGLYYILCRFLRKIFLL